ncbi:hypothetical protein CHGG_09942 [Chaetomium globosum CBS 148.51]|uniref:Uncharacterized protein n=1 Tax=Chaetomium globosum (strain ATCC 6205 / CBS 148.51 / DSM 1962 / NBRC 6347 / NRRL 1970) TaxID=306901 RepID=Q2GQ12_CHAGB|nr:uncharacterized protein CHGG_09942 [Chaetomium globosum CBS 148.51]EAQ83538.1 hypothetical protein CHGG_09942 [Chaetomium globosum CBS 148.51]
MYHNTTPQERGIRNPNAPTAAPPGGLTYGQSPTSGPAPTTAGHHKHDIINKLDPRIDSTHDRQPMPQTRNNKIPEGTYGPHSSRLANALDPRVDSDLDSTTRTGAGTGMHGTAAGAGAGYAPHGTAQAAEGTYGPHHTRMANAADPRVDSDRDRHHLGTTGAHSGGGGGGIMSGGPAAAPYQGGGTHAGMVPGHAGAGVGAAAPHNTATTTTTTSAGPHKSGLLNKLDPRVDSKTGMYKDTAGAGTRGGGY